MPQWTVDFEQEILQGDQLTPVEISTAAMGLLGMDRYRFVELRESGWAPLWIYAGYYAGQRSNAQVHAPEHCYPGSGWKIVRSKELRDGGDQIRELLITRRSQQRLVWYVYQTRLGRDLTPFGLKKDQMLAILSGRARDAMLLRMSTPILEVDGEAGARERLSRAWDRYGEASLKWFQREGGA